MDGKRFPVTFPHKSPLCPYVLLLLTSLPALPTCMLSSSPLLFPLSCHSLVNFFSKSLLVSLSSQFLSPFSIPASVICHLVSLSPASCLSVPPSLCPGARFLNQTRLTTPLPPWKSSRAPSAIACGRGQQAFSLGSKHFRLCEPNQRYYVRTYITI